MVSAIPAASEGGIENDSQPIDFDTFVPTHNPSLNHLSSLAPPMDYAQDTPSATMVSQDEAFSRALNAMYWGGYWTAMYHVYIFFIHPLILIHSFVCFSPLQCQRNLSKTSVFSAEDGLADENNKEDNVEEHDTGDEYEEFISTQR